MSQVMVDVVTVSVALYYFPANHRRRIKSKEKAKVEVLLLRGTELVQSIAALAILLSNDFKKG